jgi:competence protein ComEC
MVAVVLVCRCLYRDTSPWVGLGWALLCCVLLDPLAGYDSGFWLSFGAVAVLLLGIHGSGAARCPPWLQLLRVQWFIFVGLLIPLLLLGLPLSMLAPVANLVMVPLVSVAVVPLLLAGVMVLPLWPGLSALAWQVAGWVLGFSLQVLEYGRDLAEVIYLRSDLPLALLTAATVAVIPWLLPGLRSLRGLSLPALAALLWWGLHPPPDQHLRVTVLDVGQGLAVLIQQGERALLYDTGPGMGPALTAGSAVIVPFLRRQGVRELEQLVVSHNDVDHSGGLADVLEVIPVRQIVAGEPEKLTGVAGVSGCDEARQWRWAGSSPVQFTLLEQGQMARKGNDRSCVLLVEVGGWRLLVPGDIEAGRETELLTHPLLAERVDTLIAPHHGSRTSSTEAFLDRLHPRQVVVSSGFKNRFNHPHPLIVQRYKARGSEVLNTADSGAVSFTIGADGDISAPGLARRDGRRYWYAQPE